MEEQYRMYLAYLEDLRKQLESLTALAKEKPPAVAADDLAALNDIMKREQVLSLTLRGYDQKRDTILGALGLKGITLRQLVQHSPDELRLETKDVAEKLRQAYTLFQAASEVARDTLEVNLRAIEQIQARQAGDSAQAEEERKNHQTDFRA